MNNKGTNEGELEAWLILLLVVIVYDFQDVILYQLCPTFF